MSWVIMLLLSLVAIRMVSRYLSLDPDVYFDEQRSVYMRREAELITHVAAAMLALFVGPWQFADFVGGVCDCIGPSGSFT